MVRLRVMVNKVRFRLVALGLLGLGLGFTEFTKTATVNDNDGISKHMLINAYITYFITHHKLSTITGFRLRLNRTRRPASADRTARAANFRRELEAT